LGLHVIGVQNQNNAVNVGVPIKRRNRVIRHTTPCKRLPLLWHITTRPHPASGSNDKG
jgi:hypothetical protein